MIRRLWALPLGAHVAALLVVVAISIGAAGPGVAFFSDEGAAVLQARFLVEESSWTYEPTAPVADPEGAARPFEGGDYGTKGLAPYAKHPLYPVILAGLGASPFAAVGLSMLAVAAAAGLSAVVTRQLAPGSPSLARGVLWLVGLGSPLLFAAGLVVAHTLAAAAAAAATALVLSHGFGSAHRRLGGAVRLAGLVGACLVLGLLRTEALFFGPAIALGALTSFPRSRRRSAWLVAALAVAASTSAGFIDKAWSTSIVGSTLPVIADNRPPVSGSWIVDRLHGLYVTVVQVGYSTSRPQELLLWGAAFVVGGAALAWRTGRISDKVAALAVCAGVAAYLLRLLQGPTGSIPGVLVAFPLLGVLLVLLDRAVVGEPASRLTIVTAGVAVLAVIVTQYSNGGGLEFGWRYTTYLLPVVLPALVVGAWRTVRRRVPDPAPRRRVAAALVLLALVPPLIGLRAQASSHDSDRQVAAAIASVAPEAARDAGRPVVLSWNRLLPQILYPEFDEYEWVVPDRASVSRFAERLIDAGVNRALLVGPVAGPVAAELAELGWQVVGTGPPAPYDVLVIEHQVTDANSRS